MSLVNQMLKDLEQRRADLPRGDRLRGLRAAPDGSTATRPVRWPLLLLIAGVAGSAFGTWLAGREPDVAVPPMAEVSAPAPVATAATAVDVAAEPAQETEITVADDRADDAETNIADATLIDTEELPRENVAALETALPPTEPVPLATRSTTTEHNTNARQEPPRTAAPVMHKTPRSLTPQEQAQQSYTEALQALARQEPRAAETALRNALALMPEHAEAGETLAVLLLQQGRSADAEAVLSAALERNPQQPRLAMLRARLLAAAGHDADAVAVLQTTHSPGDADYQALLGALQQRLGDDAQAAIAYRLALAAAPQRGVWWLGLGISLERLQEPAAAAEAYRNALRDATLELQVSNYVRARIAALGGVQG